MSFDSLDLSILGPAFLAGLLVLATHVPLGQQVLKQEVNSETYNAVIKGCSP